MNEFKLVMFGSGGVGKTALTVRYVAGQFVEKYDPTIEDCYCKEVDIDGNVGVIKILDTAGTEQCVRMRDLYIKNGEGFLLVYSIIDKQSFIDVQQFRDQILCVKGVKAVPMLLIGNKCDLLKERVVATSDGEKLAAEWGVPFYETSALTKWNVKDIYIEAVRTILRSKPKSNKDGECCTLL